MRRYAFPSIETREVRALTRPVQWTGKESARLSVFDQTLKYGSTETSGYAGARRGSFVLIESREEARSCALVYESEAENAQMAHSANATNKECFIVDLFGKRGLTKELKARGR